MAPARTQLSRFAAIFAGGTMLSRVLGLVRDVVVAAIPDGSRTVFIVAFKLPNMLRDLVGEGALNAAFVPVFSKTLDSQGREAYQKLVASAMTAMFILLLVLTVLGVVFVPVLLQGVGALGTLTGGEPPSEENSALLVSVARLMFPYLLFIGMAVFAMGALFTVGHYSTPSWSPALLNVTIVVSCLVYNQWFSESRWDVVYALLVGVWLGGIAQVAVQYWALGKHAGVWRPSLNLFHPGLRAVGMLMVPVIVGQAAGEVNKLVDTLFALVRGDGAVTALFYANRLVQLPLSIFGFATAAAVLPAASKAAARGDTSELRASVSFGLRQTFFLVLPAVAGLIVLGKPIMHLLFERGGFTPDDTSRTAVALTIYAAGLLSFAWVKVTVSGFYATHDTKTPVIVASGSMVLNILLNCALIRPLGYMGLALATSISFTVNFVLLYVIFGKRFGKLLDGTCITSLVRISAATLLMAAVARAAYVRLVYLFATAESLPRLFADDALAARLVYVGVPVVLAGLSYFLFCRFLNVEELRYFTAALRSRRQ